MSGLELEITEVKYHSENTEYSISPLDITITSNNSFISPTNGKALRIFILQMKEEVLRLRHKSLNEVEKVNVTMNFKKMKLTNNALCEINEKNF